MQSVVWALSNRVMETDEPVLVFLGVKAYKFENSKFSLGCLGACMSAIESQHPFGRSTGTKG